MQMATSAKKKDRKKPMAVAWSSSGRVTKSQGEGAVLGCFLSY